MPHLLRSHRRSEIEAPDRSNQAQLMREYHAVATTACNISVSPRPKKGRAGEHEIVQAVEKRGRGSGVVQEVVKWWLSGYPRCWRFLINFGASTVCMQRATSLSEGKGDDRRLTFWEPQRYNRILLVVVSTSSKVGITVGIWDVL
jgi:hypothetical protein